MSSAANTCPNCGSPRVERFCAVCGQSSTSYLRATREIFGDVLGEVFDLDSRLARTLKNLVFHPGFLSREFASDRRATYVSPVRLYIVVSVVFFTVLSLVTRFEPIDTEPVAAPGQIELEMEADPEMARIYREMSETQRARLRGILEKQGISGEALDRQMRELDASAGAASRPPVSAFEHALSDRMLDVAEDPRGAYQTFISDLPAAMFLTLPLYALWLKLMYPGRFYAEHLVFALHLHAFLFLIGTLILVLPDAPSQSSSGFVRALVGIGEFTDRTLKLIGVGYYLAALKAFYRERWGRTVAKFVLINLAHAILIGVGVLIVTAFALAFY